MSADAPEQSTSASQEQQHDEQQEEQQQLQLVPEAVLKRKHHLDELKAHRIAQAITHPNGNRKVYKSKSIKVIKPEKFLARARSRKHHDIRYNRVKKKGMQSRASDRKVVKTKELLMEEGDEEEMEEESRRKVTYVSNSVDADVVFVIRIRDGLGMPKSVRKTLSSMRLRNVNEGVFVRYNGRTRKMLHLVEPWVSYGIPSKAIITDLINRRGHGRVDGKRIPLSDNTIIEQTLGDKSNIICVEDLVHEIYTVGPNFTDAASFLWPFRLTSPKSKFQKMKLNYKDETKEYGDRGEEMDELIRQML